MDSDSKYVMHLYHIKQSHNHGAFNVFTRQPNHFTKSISPYGYFLLYFQQHFDETECTPSIAFLFIYADLYVIYVFMYIHNVIIYWLYLQVDVLKWLRRIFSRRRAAPRVLIPCHRTWFVCHWDCKVSFILFMCYHARPLDWTASPPLQFVVSLQ